MKPLYVTVDETEKITSLGRTSIYQLITQGKIKTIKIGKRRLIVYSSLEEMANGAA